MSCSLVFLCCLDFGVWSLDHRVKFFSFHFTFFVTFPHSHSFFSFFSFFFPFYFFPLNLLSCCLASPPHSTILRPCPTASSCYLTALLCLVLPRTTTPSFRPTTSTYYLVTLLCYMLLRIVELFQTIELLNCQTPSSYLSLSLPCCLIAFTSRCLLLPRCLELPHITSLPSCLMLPHYLAAIAPQVPLETPHLLLRCLVALLPCASLPCRLATLCWLILPSSFLFCKEELGEMSNKIKVRFFFFFLFSFPLFVFFC